MGLWSDWYSKNAGKENSLTSAEFVLKKIDEGTTNVPPHNHDDRYYTESEVNTKLSGKSNTGHTHTKSDITDFPSLITIDKIYPVGSIYLSIVDTNPGTWLSGTTWSTWGTGKVPVGVDASDTSFNTVEKTGGEKTHTLTVDEMPQHNHAANGWGGESNNLDDGDLTRYAMKDNKSSDLTTTNTGKSYPHNNLQPYITCYMFKRIT
jgi:hypothetical protein